MQDINELYTDSTTSSPVVGPQGDEDLLTVYIGEIFLEFVNMLPTFQTYCLQQPSSVNMLNTLEKEKELLRYKQGFVFLSARVIETASFIEFLPPLFCVILNGKDRGVIINSEGLFWE